ncbi:MAG: histidine triad nucleotide-binding protein [Myxococcota bacterium]|nr:histidine triad nucleotide-binding protein [Myxococcota bacterium]
MTIFAKIIAGEIPAERLYEDEHVVAFRDINPQAPVHVLVVPRKPLISVAHADAEDAELLGRLLLAAARVARELGLEPGGYRLVTNIGDQGGQSVYHLHVHLLGGRQMSWPPG